MYNMQQEQLHTCLMGYLCEYGTPITLIAKTTGINRSQLNQFKLGKLELEPVQEKRLAAFLSSRGYNDAVKAFGSIVQGTFTF